MRMIILTKNISFETELQEELQILNHEVFVTRDETLLLELAEAFHYLFVSETISDHEFITLYSKVNFLYESRIVRVLPKQTQLASPLEKDMEVSYIQRSFVELRDFLGALPIEDSKGKPKEILTQEEFYRRLSERERVLFNSLDETDPISRDDLCEKVWGESATTSKKVQLSELVKNINRKLETCKFTNKRIQTLWGKGYVFQ